MKQHLFESRHQDEWLAFASLLDALERGEKAVAPASFPATYRRLC